MWSASALKDSCAYVNVLKRAKRPTPAQQASMDRGTEFHRHAEAFLLKGRVPLVADMEIQGWIDLLAERWVPVSGLPLYTEIAWGLRWGVGGIAYTDVVEPEPHAYKAADGGSLLTAGRADVAWWFSEGLRVVDWKTGVWPVAPAGQNLQALAAGIALADKWQLPAFQPGIYYARDGAWDWGDVVAVGTPEYATAVEAVKAAAMLDDKPHPGEHCGACWEKKNCAAAVLP